MTSFIAIAHIALMLETFAVATGLILINLSKENRGSFSSAGWLLIFLGILIAICTLYEMLHYYRLEPS
jgi:uncharacterized membrane protein